VFALNGSAMASAIPDKAALEAAASHSQASLTLSNIQAKPIETTAPAAAPAPAPEPTPAPAAEAPKSNGLTEDMKQALLAQDKAKESKKAKKAKGRAAAAGSAPRKGGKVASSGGFKSGGSAYDPLNGKL